MNYTSQQPFLSSLRPQSNGQGYNYNDETPLSINTTGNVNIEKRTVIEETDIRCVGSQPPVPSRPPPIIPTLFVSPASPTYRSQQSIELESQLQRELQTQRIIQAETLRQRSEWEKQRESDFQRSIQLNNERRLLEQQNLTELALEQERQKEYDMQQVLTSKRDKISQITLENERMKTMELERQRRLEIEREGAQQQQNLENERQEINRIKSELERKLEIERERMRKIEFENQKELDRLNSLEKKKLAELEYERQKLQNMTMLNNINSNNLDATINTLSNNSINLPSPRQSNYYSISQVPSIQSQTQVSSSTQSQPRVVQISPSDQPQSQVIQVSPLNQPSSQPQSQVIQVQPLNSNYQSQSQSQVVQVQPLSSNYQSQPQSQVIQVQPLNSNYQSQPQSQVVQVKPLTSNYQSVQSQPQIVQVSPLNNSYQSVQSQPQSQFIQVSPLNSNYQSVQNQPRSQVIQVQPLSNNYQSAQPLPSPRNSFANQSNQSVVVTGQSNTSLKSINNIKYVPTKMNGTKGAGIYTINLDSILDTMSSTLPSLTGGPKFTKDDIIRLIDIPADAKDGDIIKVTGINGAGLYYINKPNANNVRLLPALGSYGYFLPEQAFIKLIQNGIDYYNETGAEYALIPKGYQIRHISRSMSPIEASQFNTWTTTNGSIAITLKLKEPGASEVKVGENMITFIDRYFTNLY
jgi:hypothetical protein